VIGSSPGRIRRLGIRHHGIEVCQSFNFVRTETEEMGSPSFIIADVEWVTLPPEIAELSGYSRGDIRGEIMRECPKCNNTTRTRILGITIQNKQLAVMDCRVCDEFLWIAVEAI